MLRFIRRWFIVGCAQDVAVRHATIAHIDSSLALAHAKFIGDWRTAREKFVRETTDLELYASEKAGRWGLVREYVSALERHEELCEQVRDEMLVEVLMAKMDGAL
jgi:hypothetical protein